MKSLINGYKKLTDAGLVSGRGQY